MLSPLPKRAPSRASTETLEFEGHLDLVNLEGALGAIEGRITPGTKLIVDCTEMTDYDTSARAHFVAWHRAHREHIAAVAILTSKPLWHMIVSAMALASGQRMKAFEAREQALDWLNSR